MAALLWLIAGVLLVAVEVLSGDLVLLMLGVGSLAAAGSSALGAPLLVDVAVFAVASLGLVTVARPALRRRLQPPELTRTNVEALVGGTATVVSTVDTQGGRVKIGGDVWSARAYDPTEVLEPGRAVTVMEISGATAVVWGGP
ncbi:NfeD family protein [Streptoalloteichus hindustanus]|uniref:Membrane protein implicated in regulation of membrane protease activity n=1 Tax=Streptoalloteichus hindustanus TaxID=2017 RepID=A0A1M5PN72_STRHI|nr:NfeD family protein [Streptoalloteichus hindustanus]SHH03181.1 Membrane protein implicated in regulation of membrane protease activity [Streptoalloteichus hindustanus]